MKKIYLLLGLAVFALPACTQLNDDDRAFLNETRSIAIEARDAAKQSARDAEAAAKKADRIYRQSQDK